MFNRVGYCLLNDTHRSDNSQLVLAVYPNVSEMLLSGFREI